VKTGRILMQILQEMNLWTLNVEVTWISHGGGLHSLSMCCV